MTTIAVVGAGYAGAYCIKHLENKPPRDTEIKWINQNPHHLILHETHKAISNPATQKHLKIPIASIKNQETEFIQTKVQSLDINEKKLKTTKGQTEYDKLVIAWGQRTATYGIPGIPQHSLTMRSLSDAKQINKEITQLKEKENPNVVIGGGGLSGVQTAGEIHQILENHGNITIVEALPRILPKNHQKLDLAVSKELRSKGILTITEDPVIEADDSTIYLSSGIELEQDVFIWTGGLTSRDIDINPSPERGGRDAYKAEQSLHLKDKNDVYVAGDAGIVMTRDGQAPATAWAARDMGRVTAENVYRDITKRDTHKDLRLNERGTLVSIGDSVVGHIRGRIIRGRTARAIKKAIIVRHVSELAGGARGVGKALSYL